MAAFVVGGRHAVSVLLGDSPHLALEVWIRRSADDVLDKFATLARELGITVHFADEKTLDKVHGDDLHQGIVARRRPPELVALDALADDLAAADHPALLLLLDEVQDPRNFGACLRAADGAGVDAVVFPRARSAPLSQVVARAASGAVDTVRLVEVANLAAAMGRLRETGVWTTGAVDDAPVSIYDHDLSGASALVLGNEGRGLRQLTRTRCDHLTRIPMHGRIPSLNVATAAAVCLFEARRQRSGH